VTTEMLAGIESPLMACVVGPLAPPAGAAAALDLEPPPHAASAEASAANTAHRMNRCIIEPSVSG
jgi:hypothetical protein